jgi:hypothetical protein
MALVEPVGGLAALETNQAVRLLCRERRQQEGGLDGEEKFRGCSRVGQGSASAGLRSPRRSPPASPRAARRPTTFRHPDGVQGAFQNEFLIHLRAGEPCVRCGTYVCPTCQPRPRAAAPSARRRRPVGAEERVQLLRVELGLPERCEVPAARSRRITRSLHPAGKMGLSAVTHARGQAPTCDAHPARMHGKLGLRRCCCEDLAVSRLSLIRAG